MTKLYIIASCIVWWSCTLPLLLYRQAHLTSAAGRKVNIKANLQTSFCLYSCSLSSLLMDLYMEIRGSVAVILFKKSITSAVFPQRYYLLPIIIPSKTPQGKKKKADVPIYRSCNLPILLWMCVFAERERERKKKFKAMWMAERALKLSCFFVMASTLRSFQL